MSYFFVDCTSKKLQDEIIKNRKEIERARNIRGALVNADKWDPELTTRWDRYIIGLEKYEEKLEHDLSLKKKEEMTSKRTKVNEKLARMKSLFDT